MTIRAGIVGVQGDVAEHATAIERAASRHDLAVETCEIRSAGIVPDCDILAIPGGESTTISRLVHGEGIAPEIVDHVEQGKPVLATCAGLILASRDANDDRVEPLGLLDVTVDRNAFGRQRESFETALEVKGIDDPFPAVFIRAPAIRSVGRDVEVLATHEDRIVAVREGPVIGTAFHPELAGVFDVHDLAFFGDA
ncbi:MAG: pyridoxal 5'-phosphate synthase glutaminase subunit PdxT [Halanaeroarchaeum sp.]